MIVSKAARLFLFFILSLVVQAALASSSIVGFVTVKGPDAPVGPLANAFVMVANPAFPKQTIAVGQTNAQGFYNISGLAPGTYMVTFSTPGFLQGILSSFNLPDNQTVQVNAQLVPSLTGTEVAKNNVKDETAYTIHNPNSFAVHFTWSLPQHHANGAGTALPGDTIIDPNQWPHSENISLFVDGSQVQKATTTVVSAPVTTGNLTGFVTGAGGAPLGGAQVTLTDSGNNQVGSTFTLATGSYLFSNVPGGTYTLSYSATGYVSANQSYNLPLGGGQAPTIQLAPIPIPPSATVDVTVLTDSGGPAPAATVSISYANGSSASGPTDGNGFVSFAGQPVGVAATISADANDGSGRQTTTSTSGFMAGANALTLTLPPLPRGVIAGTVKDSGTNSPIAGATVAIQDPSNNVVSSTTTATDGTYSVTSLIHGTYTVSVSASHYNTATVGGVIVQPGLTTTQDVLLTSTFASVDITVLDTATGLGVPNTDVSISYADGSTAGPLTTDGNGFVEFTRQESGVGATINALVLDGFNRTASQSLPNGFVPGVNPISLTVPAGPSTLTGVITDAGTGLPVVTAQITVVDQATFQPYSATSDGHGVYTITGLPSSAYSLDVVALGYQENRQFFQIGQETTLTLDVPMGPATLTGTIKGLVFDKVTNAPIGGANVQVTDAVTGHSSSTATGPDGTYTISGLEPSKYSFTASAANYQTFSTAGLPIQGGQTTVQNAPLFPASGSTATVVVTVMDGTRPYAGASVTISYSDRTSAGPVVTGPDGIATFTNQKAGVGATVQATATDGRVGSFSSAPGFGNGTNNVTITLPPPVGSTATFTGPVIDARTGFPIVGANVALNDSNGRTVASGTTDKGGTYLFTVPAGSYTAVYTATGYLPFSIAVALFPGQATPQKTVAMTPSTITTATVAVTVIDGATGRGASSASVTISYVPFVAGIPTLLTDANGLATFTNQPTGTNATVTANSSDGRTASQNLPGGFASGSNSVTMTLPASTGGSISGTVFDATTRVPLSGVSIAATDLQGLPAGLTTSARDGTYSLSGLTQGTYNVTFSLRGYQSQTDTLLTGKIFNALLQSGTLTTAQVTINVTDTTKTAVPGASVTITYADGSPSASGTTDASGNVTFSGQPVQVSATISATTNTGLTGSLTTSFPDGPSTWGVVVAASPGSISGQVVDANTHQPLSGVAVTIDDWNGLKVAGAITNAFGSYSVPNLVPGTYSATYFLNGYQLLTLTIPVDAGRDSQGNAALMPNAPTATVTVAVVDSSGVPVLSAVVYVQYIDSTVSAPFPVNPSGVATMPNQPVGLGGTIFVQAGQLNGSVNVPTGFSAGANNYTVVVRPPTGSVTGVVMDSSTGSPLGRVTVTVTDFNNAVVGTVSTGPDGRYSISNIPGGSYTITFIADGYGTQLFKLSITGGQTTTQDATLTPTSIPTSDVSLTVLDPQNNRVPNAAVTVTYSNGAPSVTGTTDASGNVTFAAQPAGVSATINVVSDFGNGIATQTFTAGSYSGFVHIQPTHSRVTVIVVAGDGSGPVGNAMVTIGGQSAMTDFNGMAVFDSVPLGLTRIDAVSSDFRAGGDQFNILGAFDTCTVAIF